MTSGRPPSALPQSTLYRADAVVLRQRDLGEADRVLTLFTAEHGKLRVSVRGARKPKSRLGGHLEPLTRAAVQIARGRTLDVVTQAQAVEVFHAARADFLTLLHGLHMAELVDRFTQEQEPQEELFALLLESLRRLDAGHRADSLARAFEIQVLSWAGFQPVLNRCVSCDADVNGSRGQSSFSAQLGGLLCSSCASAQPGWTRAIPMQTVRDLQALQREGLDGADYLSSDEAESAELEALLRWYLRYILEVPLDTAAILDRVRASSGVHPSTGSG